MIGGTDIVFPIPGDAAALESCARIVALRWPGIRFEDAITGDKFDHLADIPFGLLRELLAYRDAASEAAWDTESPESPENSMLYLIGRPEDVTVVVDNPDSFEMRSILAAIRDALAQAIPV